MNLLKTRITTGLKQPDIVEKLRSTDKRIDIPLYSKIENNVCLPTPEVFRQLCTILNCQPEDVYSKDEVDFGITLKSKHKAFQIIGPIESYKLTVRVPIALASGFGEALKQSGYPSVTAFICDCIRNLKEKSQDIKKAV